MSTRDMVRQYRFHAIGRETGAQVLVMPPSVGGTKDVGDYFKLFDYDISLLIDAIKKTKST